jgi:hypothetical protein
VGGLRDRRDLPAHGARCRTVQRCDVRFSQTVASLTAKATPERAPLSRPCSAARRTSPWRSARRAAARRARRLHAPLLDATRRARSRAGRDAASLAPPDEELERLVTVAMQVLDEEAKADPHDHGFRSLPSGVRRAALAAASGLVRLLRPRSPALSDRSTTALPRAAGDRARTPELRTADSPTLRVGAEPASALASTRTSCR